MAPSQPFVLTKEYITKAFAPLEEIDDAERRAEFFRSYVVDDVTWTITGADHDLVGTRHSLADHSAKTFTNLGRKLEKPIKFVVRSIIVDADARRACVETRGYATRKTGKPYNNEYVWLTRWNDDGKIVEVRSYFDTLLSQETLHDPE